MTLLRSLLLLTSVAACSPGWTGRAPEPGPAGPGPAVDAAGDADPLAGEDAADAAGTAASGSLGTTIATLGTPTEPGMWLKTPLVSAPVPGRVASAAGNEVAVQLLPTGGAPGSSSRLSLPAMQALGLPLTALAEVEVTAGE